jgi:hypothetical protein
MKILMCGDRNYTDENKVRDVFKALLIAYDNFEIVQGGAAGADFLSNKVAKEMNISVKEYKAEWSKYGRAAGPLRNELMLNDNQDIQLVVAFHKNIANSKGTKNMVDKAINKGIRVEIISS